MKKHLKTKLKEAVMSVLPIIVIVLLLHFTIIPLPIDTLYLFIVGAILLIAGMTLFSIGADISMMHMGEKIGSVLTKSRKLPLIIIITFIIGVFITIAEPDLKVLARQTPAVPDATLILAVAVGVGIFLVVSFLRIFFQIKLSYLLTGLYIFVFILAAFTHPDFLAVAFDSGGVTTGPITVPFIMALGIGMAAIRSDRTAEEDSFGLVGLSSIGPILTVIILGIFYRPSDYTHSGLIVADASGLREVIMSFLNHLPEYLKEVAIALFPILLFFLLFQIIKLRLKKRSLLKIMVGLIYTFLGLVFFLTAANVGFMPAGNYLGNQIMNSRFEWLIIPLGMLIGYFIVAAEPAVHVLKQQVEDITEGSISGRALGLSLSIGVAVSVGLAMLRVVTGMSIWYMLIPGYAIALILSFMVSPLFTAIAFDSGGVASGPMTATFLLPFAMGATKAHGGNIVTDAFGIVAMVAMTPLITIQCLGLLFRFKESRRVKIEEPVMEDNIIDYWEDEVEKFELIDPDHIDYNMEDMSEDYLIQEQEDADGKQTDE